MIYECFSRKTCSCSTDWKALQKFSCILMPTATLLMILNANRRSISIKTATVKQQKRKLFQPTSTIRRNELRTKPKLTACDNHSNERVFGFFGQNVVFVARRIFYCFFKHYLSSLSLSSQHRTLDASCFASIFSFSSCKFHSTEYP